MFAGLLVIAMAFFIFLLFVRQVEKIKKAFGNTCWLCKHEWQDEEWRNCGIDCPMCGSPQKAAYHRILVREADLHEHQ
jgi:hypothetical protein